MANPYKTVEMEGELRAVSSSNTVDGNYIYPEVRIGEEFLQNVFVPTRVGHLFFAGVKGKFIFAKAWRGFVLLAVKTDDDLILDTGEGAGIGLFAYGSGQIHQAAAGIHILLILSVIGIALIPVYWIWIKIYAPMTAFSRAKATIEQVEKELVSTAAELELADSVVGN